MPQQVACNRVRDGIGAYDMKERRETEGLKLIYLLSWPTCFSGRLGWSFPEDA